MHSHKKREARNLFPRWREFKNISNLQELTFENSKNNLPKKNIELIYRNWEQNKTIYNAIELVNSAFVANLNELAIDAAEFLITNGLPINHPLYKVVKIILGQPLPSVNNNTLQIQEIHNQIGDLINTKRKLSRDFQSNPINWVDLARLFCIVGNIKESERCIKIALHLAPNNAFVLRSAVRLYIHLDDKSSFEYAHKIIKTSESVKYIPWVMATEISLSTHLKKPSKFIKHGLKLIESKNLSHFSLSELSAAIGTEELIHGKNKKAKKLFRNSLIDPNENTIAQSEWATKILGDLPLPSVHNSFEAKCNIHVGNENFSDAYSESLKWMADQPFSREPFQQASFFASAMLDNHDDCIEICSHGLKANPNDFTLLNNKAYSFAVLNKAEDAQKVFDLIDYSKISDDQKPVYLATKGIIEYRKNGEKAGLEFYEQAENLAINQKNEELAFRVKVYKFKSDIHCNTENKNNIDYIIKLIDESKEYKNKFIKQVLKNIQVKFNIQQ